MGNPLPLLKSQGRIAIDYTTKIHLAGRLKYFVEKWEKHSVPNYIKTILTGMSIPFRRKPPLMPASKKNLMNLKTEKSPTMKQEITKLLQMRALEKCNHSSVFLSRLFLVQKSDGGQRPVLNLKPLNSYITVESGPSTEGNCLSLPNSEPPTSPGRLNHSGPSSRGKQIKIGGLENTGWHSLVKDWTTANIALLEISWRKSTLCSYKSAWNRWLSWCTSNSVSHSNPSAINLDLFLCYLHTDLKLAPRTIKVHKSVICTFESI